MRESGYYWVKNKQGEWYIAEWYKLDIGQGRTYDHWVIAGIDINYQDDFFSEIDERKIVREEPTDGFTEPCTQKMPEFKNIVFVSEDGKFAFKIPCGDNPFRIDK